MAAAPNAIYAAGEIRNGAFPGSTNAGGTDAWVSKLDPDGNLVWSRQFGTSSEEKALGVAGDSTGVYVVGYTSGSIEGTNSGGTDIFVRKYDPSGNILWTRQFGSVGSDRATAVAVDAAGVYVAGFANRALPGQTAIGGDDAFLRKYDFGGTEVWTRQFGTADIDKVWGVAVDASGIYVTGETAGVMTTRIGGSDYFLRKYDATGNAVWTRQFGSNTTDSGGYGGGVAVNSSGVYVAGLTAGTIPGQTKVGGPYDPFVQKFDFDGNTQWVRQFGTTGDDGAYAVAVGGGFVYVAGQDGSGLFMWRFDYSGADKGNIMKGTFATLALGAASDGNGAYIAGGSSGAQLGQTGVGDQDAFVFKVPHPPQLDGAGDAFTGQNGVAPTTWTALYGTALAGSTRLWDSAIVGTQLPTSLDEVTVSINGRPATIYFVSPGQVNVLAPLDDTIGTVEITLTNRYGTSSIQIAKTNYLPSFYAPFGLFVTAVGLDGTYIGRSGIDPRVTRAARPGEIVQIFASGFGPTNPAAPSDKIFAGAPALPVAPRITIGGQTANFIGTGNLVAPGLYQFNVTVPDLPNGDHAIVAEIGGARSRSDVFLSVQR